LAAKGEVISRDFGEKTVIVHVRLPSRAMGPVQKSALSVEETDLSKIDPTVPHPITGDSQIDLPTLSMGDASSEVA
jgi:hypothetical protein